MTDGPHYLTVAQVADELAVSARTVLRWINSGHLEAVRLPGGRLRVGRAELSRFLADAAIGTMHPTDASGPGDAVNVPDPGTGGESDA